MSLQHHMSSKALQLRVGHDIADCSIRNSRSTFFLMEQSAWQKQNCCCYST